MPHLRRSVLQRHLHAAAAECRQLPCKEAVAASRVEPHRNDHDLRDALDRRRRLLARDDGHSRRHDGPCRLFPERRQRLGAALCGSTTQVADGKRPDIAAQLLLRQLQHFRPRELRALDSAGHLLVDLHRRSALDHALPQQHTPEAVGRKRASDLPYRHAADGAVLQSRVR